MTLKRPLWMQPAGGDTPFEYSGLDDRDLFQAVFASEGVLDLASLKVSQRGAGANFSVDVAAGGGVITGDDAAGQGRYLVRSTAVENLVIPAPPGAGSRAHRVIARVNDHLHNGALAADTYTFSLEVLEDTGTGTPALPNTAISLAIVTVASTTPSVTDGIITDARVTAQTVPGRPTQVASDAGRPVNPVIGEAIWRTDKNYGERWDGTGWRIEGGVVSLFRFTDLSRTSTTVLSDDSDLTGTVPAGIYYELTGQLVYSTRSDTDFKFKFVGPTGATFDGKFSALLPSATGISGDVPHDREVINTDYTFGGAAAENTTYMVVAMSGIMYSGDGGTFKVQWAQSVSNATATIMRGKSFVTLRPVR